MPATVNTVVISSVEWVAKGRGRLTTPPGLFAFYEFDEPPFSTFALAASTSAMPLRNAPIRLSIQARSD
jgi:hypothetical protein